jgi:apolipoprotein D and lipocalin family protein
MGTWFVIAVKPTYFERTCCNAVEKYTLNEDKVRIGIDFSYTNEGSEKVNSLPQKGWVNSPTGSEWKVSPMWPLKMPYLILEAKEDDYCVIGYPSRDYLWIMSRKPTLEKEKYDTLIGLCKEKHLYDMTGLRLVPQVWTKELAAARGVEKECGLNTV